MERLTEKRFSRHMGEVFYCFKSKEKRRECYKQPTYEELYRRLADLEDKLESGELVNITEPLPLVNGRYTKRNSTYYERAIKRLQELEDKLESGQLVGLPCIREIKDHKGIKYQICFIRDNTYNIGSIDYYETRDKTQAEARLKELQGK